MGKCFENWSSVCEGVSVSERKRETDKESKRKRGLWKESFCTHPVFKQLSIPTAEDNCGKSVSQVTLVFLWVVCASVPDLIADFLLILFPVTSTATAEEDDSNQDEDQEYRDYGCCDDTCRVGGWKGKNRVEWSGKCSVDSNHVTLGLHSMNSNYCVAFNYSFGCPLLMTKERPLLSISLNS